MESIQHPTAPADITVGEGLSAAADYWRRTWDVWLLPVIALGIIGAATTWLLGSITFDQVAFAQDMRRADMANMLLQVLPTAAGVVLITTLASVVVSWILLANAVAGLRGRPLSAGWIVGSGLRATLASLLLAGAVVAVFGLTAILAPRALPVVFLLGIVPLAYLFVRLTFWQYAIFDGAGITAGLRASLAISRGGVLRIIGWNLALVGIGLAVGLGAGLVNALFQRDFAAVGGGITASVNGAFTAYQLIATAILYESQRMRQVPQPPPAPTAIAPTSPWG